MKKADATSRKAEVERIMNAGYSEELKRNSDGSYFARVVEFPGCMTEGDTQADALSNLKEAMRGWIDIQLEDGQAIPPPQRDDQFSGKFVVRVPKSVHRDLSRRAELEGVSLNQYVLAALAKAIGRKAS